MTVRRHPARPRSALRFPRLAAVVAAGLAAATCGRGPAETLPADVPAPPEAPAAPAAPAPAPAAAPGDAGATAGPKGEIPPDSREPAAPAPVASTPVEVPAAPPAPPPQPPRAPVRPEVRAALDAAAAKIAAGDANDAIEDLRRAESALGDDPDLRLAQARAFLALADDSLARGDDGFQIKGLVADAHLRWKQATAMDARVPGAAVVRARVYRFEENPVAARELLAAHLAEFPDDADAHLVLADMATAARDWQAADDHWTKVAVLQPANGHARMQATIAKQWMRAPAETLEAGYLEASRLLPADGEPVRMLAQLYPSDRTRKVAVLEKAVAQGPEHVWARVWLAHVLRTEQPADPARATALLEEAVKADPRHAAAQYNLGLALEQAGKPVDAVRAYTACVENSADGECAQASDSIDRLLHAPDSPARDVPLTVRVRACDAVCAKNTSVGRYGNNAGFWFRDVGRDYELSAKYYEKACEAEPDDQDYLNDTGLIYLFHLTDRKERCRAYFDRVVELVEEQGLDPVRGYWDTLENLCKYWFDKGDFARVVELAKKRADPRASINGMPYPSAKAAGYGAAAKKRLEGR